jgi:hypothetical protein
MPAPNDVESAAPEKNVTGARRGEGPREFHKNHAPRITLRRIYLLSGFYKHPTHR